MVLFYFFSIDDLLRAGINLADNVVVVNKETSNSAEEETLADCNTIVAVQTIFRYALILLNPISKLVFWQTMKTLMNGCIRQHFIWACTVCSGKDNI